MAFVGVAIGRPEPQLFRNRPILNAVHNVLHPNHHHHGGQAAPGSKSEVNSRHDPFNSNLFIFLN